MDIDNTLINRIKCKFPKFYIIEIIDDNVKFEPENDVGFIEYKRTLVGCDSSRMTKYATQMKWRLTENFKHNYAIYFIGVDDDGTISNLCDADLLESFMTFVSITKMVDVSIAKINIIRCHLGTIIKIKIKNKNKTVQNNYLII